jgi:Na+/H+-dicarboxylate symporter
MKKLALHWWILIGMIGGVGFGILAAQLDFTEFVVAWVKPFGDLFMNLLKMIAVPLVLFSLVAGVASLNDTAKVGRIGGKTIALYLGTTAIAITIGLVVVNVFDPGTGMSQTLVTKLQASFADEVTRRENVVNEVRALSPLAQFFSQIVPTNPFGALSSGAMLQVVFFALMLGIALTRLDTKAADHVIRVFQLLSDAIIEMVLIIMKIAPFGVFALIASVIAEMGKDPDELQELLGALAMYMFCVVLALFLHGLIVYVSILKLLAKIPLARFFKGMVPAQLLAFSSSSSGATLPVTMRCVEKNIGVDEEVSGFVLPLGATINMDGTGLYQGVAAVFIANALNHDLDMGDQLSIVLTATLASIGTAAVPGVGIVMLIIVLDQIGIGAAGIALILGVDRPLDMCRTVLNVTGDATVAVAVASSEGAIHDPSDRPTEVVDLDAPIHDHDHDHDG